jgi:nicotinamidase-related amidase
MMVTTFLSMIIRMPHAGLTMHPTSPHVPPLPAGCEVDRLFTRGSWNATICDAMTPEPADVVVKGKRGLSAFPDTDLEEHLKSNGIETIAIGGTL